MTERKKKPAKPADDDVDVRVLPHDIQTEKAVLGAIIANNGQLDRAVMVLKPEHFFRRAHQIIFRAMAGLNLKRQPIDLVTLKDALLAAGDLQEVGGPAYLASVADGMPRSANLESYAQTVRRHAYLRTVIRLGHELIDQGYTPGTDPLALVGNADRRLLELQRGTMAEDLIPLADGGQALYDDLARRYANRGQLLGAPSGFKQIDDLTMGWQAGDMAVIAARPSMGKSLITLNFVAEAAKAGYRVGVFSLEMRRRQVEHRLLAHLGEIDAQRLRSGCLSELDFERVGEAYSRLMAMSVSISDKTRQTVQDIRNACRRMANDGGLGMIVVDYIQLIPGSLDRRGANRNEEMTDIGLRLKDLADEMNVPTLVMSQLNRNSSKFERRPGLHDLRESGSLEQIADLVAFLHRKTHKASGLTEFILEKQRNGPTGTVMLMVNRQTQSFREATEEEIHPPKEEKPHDDTPKPPKGWKRG